MFLMRDSSCLDQIPEDTRQDFLDTEYQSIEKLKILKQMIKDTFPVSFIVMEFLL